MVAAALGERYGEGNVEAGRAFLEKIVQVPLHLPPADQLSLRKLTFDGVDATLRLSGIELTEEEAEVVARHFVDGLEPRLATPRQAKLFVNVLQFSLPILKGEVHPVDQILIEGIRIFYPKLYVTIRDNPEYFLKAARDSGRDDTFRRRATELIDAALEGSGIMDKETVRRRLLEVLFPRVKNTVYGSSWDEVWNRQKRICAVDYFERYFSYGVPSGDVPDFKINQLLETASSVDETELAPILTEVGAANGMARLISKLRLREDRVQPGAAARLALALCHSASLLPRETQIFFSDWTFSQAAILVVNLARRLPFGDERDDLARRVILEAQPLPFAFECLKWFGKDADQPEADRVIPAELEQELRRILAERVRSEAAKMPLCKSMRSDAPRLFWIWNRYAPSGEVEAYLRTRFEANPAEIDDFLTVYVGKAWDLDGLSHAADFERSNFVAVASLISPELIFMKLKERYGSELGTAHYYQSDNVPLARRIAHQFASIYEDIKKEQENKSKSQTANT